MKLTPTRGLIFVVPVDVIVPAKPEMGFGSATLKHKAEEPYKFRAVSVGGPLPFEGMFVPSEVEPGDIVTLNLSNQAIRDKIADGAGFLVDTVWHYPIDFRDVIGIWREDEDTEAFFGSTSAADIPF